MFKFAANLSLLFQEYAFLDEAPAEEAAAKGFFAAASGRGRFGKASLRKHL